MRYDKEKTIKLCENLKLGMTRIDACTLSEIGDKVFRLWMKNTEFYNLVKKAEAEAKKRNIGLINKAAMNHWGAAAYWLEHMYPKEFGKKTKLVFPDMTTQEMFESITIMSENEIDNCLDGIIKSLPHNKKHGNKLIALPERKKLPGRKK